MQYVEQCTHRALHSAHRLISALLLPFERGQYRLASVLSSLFGGDLILLASGNTCSRNSALLLWANHCILVHINRCVYGPLSRDYQSGRNWEECSSDGKTRAMQKVTPDCCFAGSTTTRITGVKLVANPAVWVAVMGQNPGCDQADMLRMSLSSSNDLPRG